MEKRAHMDDSMQNWSASKYSLSIISIGNIARQSA